MVTEITLENKAYIASSSVGTVLLSKTIAQGANLEKGTILGRVTASSKLAAFNEVNADGTENPVAVLMDTADAADTDVEAVCGFAGVYVEDSMIGLDLGTILILEERGIYFK